MVAIIEVTIFFIPNLHQPRGGPFGFAKISKKALTLR